MPGHDEVGVPRDEEQPLRLVAPRFELVELRDQHRRIDDAAGADRAPLPGDDARRDLPDLVGLVSDDDRVAGVRAALVAADEIGVLREEVDDLSLPFVAPLRADDDGRGHARQSCRSWAPSDRRRGEVALFQRNRIDGRHGRKPRRGARPLDAASRADDDVGRAAEPTESCEERERRGRCHPPDDEGRCRPNAPRRARRARSVRRCRRHSRPSSRTRRRSHAARSRRPGGDRRSAPGSVTPIVAVTTRSAARAGQNEPASPMHDGGGRLHRSGRESTTSCAVRSSATRT